MANFSVTGLAELYEATNKAKKIPRSVTEDILKRMGRVLESCVRKRALARGIWDTGEVVRAIKLGKPKATDDGGTISVTFSGSRTRGNITTRNALIAFVNEFGKKGKKKGQAPRPFVKEAKEMSADQVNAEGAEGLYRWLNQIGL